MKSSSPPHIAEVILASDVGKATLCDGSPDSVINNKMNYKAKGQLVNNTESLNYWCLTGATSYDAYYK